MGTLADEERTFLLKATGLPEDSSLTDLRYAYFKGVNTGEIEQGTKLPDPPTYSSLLRVDGSGGNLSWINAQTGPAKSSIPVRDYLGHIDARTDTEPRADQYVSRANVDKMIAGKTGTSRVDTTVGKRIFVSDGTTEHMVYGDTGWRDISELVPAGLFDMRPGSRFWVRRRDKTVEIAITAWTSDGLSSVSKSIATPIIEGLPNEFRAYPSTGGSLATGLILVGGLELVELTNMISHSGIQLRGTGAGSWLKTTGIRLHGQWPTYEAWPTGPLPGKPAQ